MFASRNLTLVLVETASSFEAALDATLNAAIKKTNFDLISSMTTLNKLEAVVGILN
jgi:hypothetical protein